MKSLSTEFNPLAYEFKQALYSFYSRRNGFTHCEIMDYEEFKEQCNDFNSLLRFFPELMRRKRAVKPESQYRDSEWE